MEKLYRISKKKKRLGADCDSGHELLIAKFRLKLKKVWKTTTSFRSSEWSREITPERMKRWSQKFMT